jgi:hypothetical protein
MSKTCNQNNILLILQIRSPREIFESVCLDALKESKVVYDEVETSSFAKLCLKMAPRTEVPHSVKLKFSLPNT